MKQALRRAIFAGIVLVLSSGSASAVPINCDDAETLADLIASVDGCIQQDKLFNHWAYTAADPENVNVTFNLLTAPTQDIHGLTFERLGGWDFDFTLSYTVSVMFGPFAISAVDTQWNWPLQPSGNAQATTTYSDSSGAPTVLVAAPGDADAPPQVLTGAVIQSDVTHAYLAGDTGNVLKTIETAVVQSVIPEPGTYALMGSALLALGVLIRRRK